MIQTWVIPLEYLAQDPFTLYNPHVLVNHCILSFFLYFWLTHLGSNLCPSCATKAGDGDGDGDGDGEARVSTAQIRY